MEEKQLKLLKGEYGFNIGSYKYVMPGCEIMRYIGQTVVMVDFRKKEDGQWEHKMEKVIIVSITDHDPNTMTYLCKYKMDDSEEIQEERIIPEGYSWGIPEESGYMKKFLPYSMHCQAVEDEYTIARVEKLYGERETLDLELLKALSADQGQEQVFKYSHNIGLAIKLNTGEFLWMRIHGLKLKHRQGKKYGLFINNDKYNWPFVIMADDKEYNFFDEGTFKILDLSGE